MGAGQQLIAIGDNGVVSYLELRLRVRFRTADTRSNGCVFLADQLAEAVVVTEL